MLSRVAFTTESAPGRAAGQLQAPYIEKYFDDLFWAKRDVFSRHLHIEELRPEQQHGTKSRYYHSLNLVQSGDGN